MKTPICDFVKNYAEGRTARLHMPGHKGAAFLGCEGRDITEIAGADSLYEAMKRFLAMDPEERAAMGRAGRKHMEEVFDKKKVVEQTIKGLGL